MELLLRKHHQWKAEYYQLLDDNYKNNSSLIAATYNYNTNEKKLSVVYDIAIDSKGQCATPFITKGEGIDRSIDIQYSESKNREMSIDEAYFKAIDKNVINNVINILQKLYDVKDIRERKVNNEFVLYILNKNGSFPISLSGDGFKWSFILLCDILTNKDGIILIDDFENFQHPSSLYNVVESLIESTNINKNQFFVSTHSLECIDTFIDLCYNKNKSLNIHFLKKDDKNIVYDTNYNLDEAREARKEISLDLRGI